MAHAPPTSLRAKIGLVIAGVVVALAIGECAVRATSGGYRDSLRELAAVAVEPDRITTHRLRANTTVTVDGVEYRINSIGTRGAEPAARRPSRRVLVLGDSVTMGWGVPEPQTWPMRVQRSMRRHDPEAEVVNAAVLGWGLEQYVKRMEQLSPSLRPDVVLVGYFPNDPAGTDAVGPTPLGSELWRALVARLAPGPSATEHHRALHAESGPGWRVVQRSFGRIGQLCGDERIRCGVVLIPSLNERPYPLIEEHRRLTVLASEHELPILDLAPTIAGRERSELWVAPDDTHPNAEAHRLYADAIAAWLETLPR